jgi:sugar phosphate isomerase/epimerase
MSRKCLVAGIAGVVIFGFFGMASAAPKQKGAAKARKENREPVWRLSVQTYTWNKFTFFEAVDRAKEDGVKVVEGFSWQKLSPDLGKAELNPEAPEEAITKTQEKLKESGVRLLNLYVSKFGKDEADYRKWFEFGKKMGIKTFVSEPDAKTIDALDPLCQEYKIRLAIHNHPKHDEKYTNWNPDNVIKLISGHSKFVGCCADTGHWVRSSLDPVECLKKYEGHIFCLHLKDVNEKGPKGEDVPFGTGVSNVKGQLEELARQKFTGVISIEYESKKSDNREDVKKCVEYFNKTAGEIGTKLAAR